MFINVSYVFTDYQNNTMMVLSARKLEHWTHKRTWGWYRKLFSINNPQNRKKKRYTAPENLLKVLLIIDMCVCVSVWGWFHKVNIWEGGCERLAYINSLVWFSLHKWKTLRVDYQSECFQTNTMLRTEIKLSLLGGFPGCINLVLKQEK